MIVAMRHESRRFVEKVDFITSPGFLSGGNSRYESGLRAGGMFRVITNLGIFGFDEQTRAMKVLALHDGVTLEEVKDNTGFDLLHDEHLQVTQAPTEQELQALRELDPDRRYIA